MISIRTAQLADADVICSHRVRMFAEAGTAPAAIAAMAADFRPWLDPRLRDRRYLGFLAEDQNMVVAGIGVMELDWAPHPLHPGDPRRGYILNVRLGAHCRDGKNVPARLAPHLARSKRSRFITLPHAATKSCTNFSCASALA